MKKACIFLFLALIGLDLSAQTSSFTLNVPVQGLCFEKAVDMNGATALDDLSKYNAGADFVYGLRFIPQERIPGAGFLNALCSMPLHLAAGLGVHYGSALIQHDASTTSKFSTYDNELLIPLFVRGKIDINPGIISPFIACDAGYAFAIRSSEYGQKGWFIQPQLGIDIHSELADLYLAIGLNRQNSCYRYCYYFSDKYISANNPDKVMILQPVSQALSFHIGFRW